MKDSEEKEGKVKGKLPKMNKFQGSANQHT